MEDGSFRSRDSDHEGADGEHYTEFDHEAMLGSVKEAEEFHQLSPEESKRRLEILVSTKIDTNKDQFIDKHELKAHILRSFKWVLFEFSVLRRIIYSKEFLWKEFLECGRVEWTAVWVKNKINQLHFNKWFVTISL